jgi:beta-glucosidase
MALLKYDILLTIPQDIFSCRVVSNMGNFFKYKSFLFSGLLIISVALGQLYLVYERPEELRWDWVPLAQQKLEFPQGFLFGAATSEYQISGKENCGVSNWTHHEDYITQTLLGSTSGKACDHWQRYSQDIGLLKEIGLKAYRFSVEWSLLEPEEGVFDDRVLDHYEQLCDQLLVHNIVPMVTLHHFTHPLWFEQKKAFEKKENIAYFVRFCCHVFERLAPKVSLWCTFNEPGIYVFLGYITGHFPPARTMFDRSSLELAGKVTQHLMEAHVELYKALKSMEGGSQVSIGLAHSLIQVEPYHPANPVECIIAFYLNQFMHNAITQFLKTQTFGFYVPFLANITFDLPEKTKILDFIGLNYYSHVMFNWQTMGPDFRSGEIPTDMPYGIYPEGLYRAIREISCLGVPIYITENGIADAKDDRRDLFLRRYLYALWRAIQDGYDVRGYFYWSLMDNFEWNRGFEPKFGLYKVNFDTQERTLRPGASYLREIAQAHDALAH